jgi:hypothetical protein
MTEMRPWKNPGIKPSNVICIDAASTCIDPTMIAVSSALFCSLELGVLPLTCRVAWAIAVTGRVKTVMRSKSSAPETPHDELVQRVR